MKNEQQRIEKLIKVMEMVSADVENDARHFDGQPFTGKTIATYMGNHGAAIKAIAEAVKEVLQTLAEREREIVEEIGKKVYEGHPEGCRHPDREIVNLSDIKTLLTPKEE